MRCLFPILYYDDIRKAENIAVMQGKLTHFGYISERYICMYTRILSNLKSNPTLTMLRHLILKEIPTSVVMLKETPNDGYVKNTFLNVVRAIQTNNSFEDTIVDIVNRGGDTDTIAAICGGLIGYVYGYEQIPKRWIEALQPKVIKSLEQILTNF